MVPLVETGKMMPLSRLVQDVRELYLGKTQPTTPETCNAMSPRVILIRLTQKKNELLSDEEETVGNEWNMNILEPVVEISDKPKDNTRKRKGRAVQGASRKRGKPPKVQENNFIDVSIKQEPSDPLPVSLPLEEVPHNVPMATIPVDSNATPTLPMYQVPAANLAVYVSQPQPLVLQHTVAVQNTNLLIDQPPNVDSPSTSDKPNHDIHSEVDLGSNIKQEEQMENVFVMPFGGCIETENKSSPAKPSTEPDVVECESPDDLARKNRSAAIAANIDMGGSSHRKLRDLTFKLVELNNKNLKCDNRIDKIKEEFKKRLQTVEIEKKGIEQEIDKVLASIQDWKEAKKQ